MSFRSQLMGNFFLYGKIIYSCRVMLDDKWDLKLDPVNLSNKWFMETMKHSEVKAKFQILESEYNSRRGNYMKSVREFMRELVCFSEDRREDIDLLRTQEMLMVGPRR